MKPAQRPGIRTVTDAKALSAMANPFRSRMMDALKVDGPSTASALAARTGQAVGSASHHLKVLAEAGLVEEAPELAKDRRERWWRLVDSGTRWSRADFADDTAAVTAAYAAEALALQRQFERTQTWNANAASAPEWDAAAFATQNWMRLTPDELTDLANEVVDLLMRWSRREVPDDGVERESVLVFARGFPAQP
ncbi:DNA-binding transcriptional regulator, ArsR family [Pedococcus dokdonensis]|uniref:DNA-binding transcriptional regulator, ArsR family n=1 Tax=Pedococcus dokdonensis TaxID=443156 RepID=A0A1H0P4N3_9MICO|nr:winged helix-turn-helix domain-containing protein [Pedococcus dokdonensis]SDO99982.1 DNA-binding transcriptional regulator, ArsR family [Pedococcus dokdonensis]